MEMTEQDRVFDAFRNCISEPKCKNCPWTECDKLKNRDVEIPIDLALAVMRMLEAQEPRLVHVTADINHRKIGECPNCGKGINSGDYPNYCGRCGQAVKWE